MKTLVLHPKDKTTDFLKVIYKGKGYTEVNTRPSNSKLKKMIKTHDRVIILGHGTEKGMIDFSRNKMIPWVTSDLVYLLRDKTNSIYIWCNSDVFIEKYNLHGFYTGMIISDIEESYIYNIKSNIDDIDSSNKLLADTISKYLVTNTQLMSKNVKKYYNSDSNMVINFNRDNIKYSINKD